MKNRVVRALIAAMAVSLVFATPVFADPDETDTVESLEAEEERLEAEKENLEAQRQQAQYEASLLQEELTGLLDKMAQLEEKLIAKGEEIVQAKEDLEAAKKTERQQYEAMKLRIKYMYENGTSDALETLCSAKSFTDLINKAEYIAEVHSYDRGKLEEYVKTKKKIAAIKDQLVEEQKKMESLQEEYEAEEESLSATLENKRAEIEDFDVQIQVAAEAVAEAAAAREEARRQEEERRAAEEAARAQEEAREEEAEEESSEEESEEETETEESEDEETEEEEPAEEEKPSEEPSQGGNTATAQAIINAAYSQLGVPYVWGGSSSSGWDCSGLVQYCHSCVGISLPRTAAAQGGCGRAVSNPKPGDIVCYGYHVGIYIGNGQMIHAPKPGDVVKVANVFGSPWYRRCW